MLLLIWEMLIWTVGKHPSTANLFRFGWKLRANKLHDRMKITSCFTFAFDVCNFYTVLKILFSINVSCLCLFIC